jgi:hypothetical protein
MGCLDSIMKLFRAGDHVVCGENVYGGTFRLFDKIPAAFRLTFTYVDTRDPQRVADAMTPATRLVLVETPTNPMMRLTDIAAVAELAHRKGALLVVDNTFASPYFQRPLSLGADIVYHSTTKYLNGHSDMIGGIAVTADDGIAERLQFIHNAAGAVAGPFDAWLALRGTKTLHLRMRQHDANGRQIAAWLVEQIGHENVNYIGLPTHPQYDLARRQMSGFGGMISVELGTRARAAHVLGRVRVFALGRIPGGVESLISQPAEMTHASVPPDRGPPSVSPRGWSGSPAGSRTLATCLPDLEQAVRGIPEGQKRRGSSPAHPRDTIHSGSCVGLGSPAGRAGANAHVGFESRIPTPDPDPRVQWPPAFRSFRSHRAPWEHPAIAPPSTPAGRFRFRRSRAQGRGFLRRARCAPALSRQRGPVGPRQRQKLNQLYTEVLETLDWPTRPQLYVTPNAVRQRRRGRASTIRSS